MRQFCLALSCILLSPNIYAATQYRVTELAPTASYTDSYASSINNLGQIAGSSYSYAVVTNQYYYNSQATVWTLNSQTGITTAALTTSDANAINNAGHVAGSVSSAPSGYGVLLMDNPSPVTATVWSNGTSHSLNSLGGTQSSATDINDNGQVVGISKDSQGTRIATLWENGGASALSTPAQRNSSAFAINSNGVIVGTVDNGEYTGTSQAVVWNNNVLSYLNTSGLSQAFDINDSNQIVGWSDNLPGGRQYATLWDNGVATDLSILDSYASFANAINNHGAIVGSYITNGIIEEFAVLWENGQATKLADLLTNGDGISLYSADGINDQGWIVANGINSNGERRSFLLMPVPEPANEALLLAGLIIVAIRKRNASLK
jgi:probable HAF family extracellular repeat protein